MKIPSGMTRREALKWGVKLATIGVMIPSASGAVSSALIASARRRNTGGGGPVLLVSTSTYTTSAGIDTTGANFIVVSITGYVGGGQQPTITDSNGNTWTSLTTQQQNFTKTRIYYCYGPTVGSGHTFTANGEYVAAVISAWSGIAASPFDQENGATASSSTTINTGSITPSQNSVLVIANVGGNNGSATYSIDSSYTIVAQQNSFIDVIRVAQAYKILTSISSQNPQWTASATVGEFAASIGSFKA